ncbi:MAG: hypothetical protein M5U14_08515 [Acidimicrobiia bacterium]|nr:hypothetical protein [Acidimicrobiia bacterium]
MPLPPGATSHHTVWVQAGPGARPVPARYAVDGERLVAFGDDGLAGIPDGSRVTITVHEIAGGPALGSSGAVVRTLEPDAVTTNVLAELLAHVPLGRTTEEVRERLEWHRRHRRIVEIVP